MRRPLLVVCVVVCAVRQAQARGANPPDNCLDCGDTHHIVNVDEDFNKLKADPELNKYVEEIVKRLKTFKIPVHPRIRIFYELLKISMNQYAHRTADSLYVPDKYNVIPNNKKN